MSEEQSEDLIRYDILTQEAMRGLVRKVISEVAKAGLPGEHHFYISFATKFPGVRLSKRMRERYPDEMTIVVQHQFWDLKVSDNSFEIGLSFDDIPETLTIPFAAIRGFFDPSVQFGLQFDFSETDEQADDNVAVLESADGAEADTQDQTSEEEKSAAKSKGRNKVAKKDQPEADATADDDGDGAEVVSLDAFRKKP